MQNIELYAWRRPMIQSVWAMVVFTLILSGCTAALPRLPGKMAATYKANVDIRYHGFERDYLVHLPPGYDAQRPLPMVVALHGAFGTAKIMERLTGFSDLADEKQFIAVYPNGIGAMGNFQHWNAGHCCAKAAADGVDDVGFLVAVIEDACSRLAVDRNRIFMVGFSNGGMMTYRFAAEKGDMLAAIAPLAASAGGRPDRGTPEWGIPQPVRSLPVIAFHGLDDKYVPIKGGLSQGKENAREYWSVKRSLGVWEARDGCKGQPVERDQSRGKVHVLSWENCKDNDRVVLYTLEGWPHSWPGPYYTAKRDPQDPLYNFDAARIIWDFFEASSR